MNALMESVQFDRIKKNKGLCLFEGHVREQSYIGSGTERMRFHWDYHVSLFLTINFFFCIFFIKY